MCDFTLTWATTFNDKSPFVDEQEVNIYLGDRSAIFDLHRVLTKTLGYKFVTVRDKLGKKVDMSKGMLEMTLYNNNCLL